MAKEYRGGRRGGGKTTVQNNRTGLQPDAISSQPQLTPDATSVSPIEKAIGKIGAPQSPDAAVRASNPNKFRRNCQRCIIAYELNRRGYDVEALQNPDDGSAKMSTPNSFITAFGMDKYDVSFVEHGYKPTATELKQAILSNNPTNARGFLAMGNFGTSGHVISYEIINGKLFFNDPQTGKMARTASELVKKYTIFQYARTDDKTIQDNIGNFVKKRQ